MAIVRTLKNYRSVPLLFEDPIPGSQYMYVAGEQVDRGTLSPKIDSDIAFSNSKLASGNFGYTASSNSQSFLGGTLILNGEVTSVSYYTTGTDIGSFPLDVAPFVSMDPNYPARGSNYYTDTVNNVVVASYNVNQTSLSYSANSTYDTRVAVKWNCTSDRLLTDGFFDAINSQSGTYDTPIIYYDRFRTYFIYYNPTTKNVMVAPNSFVQVNGGYSGTYECQAYLTGLKKINVGTKTYGVSGGSQTSNGSSQVLGISGVDGYMLYMRNGITNDYNQYIYKYNDLNDTYTTLYSFTATPTATGTSAGGTRTTTNIPKYASRIFPDPTTPATVKGFYVPYLDVNNKYQPFYMTWTPSSDTVTRASDISITYPSGKTQADYWSYDTLSSTAYTLNTANNTALNRCLYNEVMSFNGVNYVTLFQLHNGGSAYYSYPLMRSFVTYSIDAANPKLLTFNSAITVPFTPKNVVWLNDARTIVGFFTTVNFYIYSFTGAGGWVLSSTLPYTFNAVGRDNTGRIWAADDNSAAGYSSGRLHSLSLNSPASIVVTTNDTTYNYTGTTITDSVSVSVYNSTGQRIVTTVKLVIDGLTMTFASNAVSINVTTSASAAVSVPIYIIGSGVSNITASISV